MSFIIKWAFVGLGVTILLVAACGQPMVRGAGEFKVGIASPLVKVSRDAREFRAQIGERAVIFLARKEFESVQVVVLNGSQPLKGAVVSATDLTRYDGSAYISKENIQIRLVRYVPLDRPIYPDPLVPLKPFDLEPGEVQTIWVTVYAPKGTPTGLYRGEVTVLSGEAQQRVGMDVNVWDFELPARSFLKTAFFVWGHQGYSLPVGEVYSDLLRHRLSPGSVARASVTLGVDGRLDYDFAQFDREIEKYLSLGLTTFMVADFWGSRGVKVARLPVRRSAPGEITDYPVGAVGSAQFLSFFQDHVKRYISHLKEKGWLDLAFVYAFDEPMPSEYATVRVVHQAAKAANPEAKLLLTVTGEIKPKVFGPVDIWVQLMGGFDEESYKQIRKSGAEVWWYVTGGVHPYPSLMIGQPAVGTRAIFWLLYKYGINGFLYWNVTNWPVDPWFELIGPRLKSPGDGFLYYPYEGGFVGSIRLENIRDGIEDYDYFALLRSYLDSGQVPVRQRRELEALLSPPDTVATGIRSYNLDPTPMVQFRRKLGEALEMVARTRGRPR